MEMYTESSGIDTASDMNSSTDDFSSPDRTLLKPRTLVYDESYDPPPLQTRQRFTQSQINADEDDIDALDGIQNNNVIKPSYRNGLTNSTRSRMQVVESPPYRKVRALRWDTFSVFQYFFFFFCFASGCQMCSFELIRPGIVDRYVIRCWLIRCNHTYSNGFSQVPEFLPDREGDKTVSQ